MFAQKLISTLPSRVVVALGSVVLLITSPAASLPPPDDIPDEVLNTAIVETIEPGQPEIARSNQTGAPLSAAEYVEQLNQQERRPDPKIAAEVEDLVILLRIRQVFRTIWPF
jgi:hypothetical protein